MEFHKSVDPEFAIHPDEERGLRGSPHRLLLSNKTGYISTELFECIMDEFAKWWSTVEPSLDCYLINNNLSIHRIGKIVEAAKKKGIPMINIMPGSSH